MRRSLGELFWSKVVTATEPDGCWAWTGCKDPEGYGLLWSGVKTRMSKAHRVAWELFNGPIPDGSMLLHKCPGGIGNPGCVNPAHLKLAPIKGGGHVENGLDATRERMLRGERHCTYSKTGEAVAQEIRRRYAAGGISQRALAREYGVGQPTVSNILLRKTWAHLPLVDGENPQD